MPDRKEAGWVVIARKEFSDNLLSARFVALIAVLSLAAAGAVFAASQGIKSVASSALSVPALFLSLFTVTANPIPFPMIVFIGFLGPLLGIMFGFDAINGERAQGTLPRLVAQPIHRDDVVNGKFVGALSVIGVMIIALTAFVAGIGIFRLGIVPDAGEIARLLIWIIFVVVYVGFWLALATLMSVVVRRTATSALITVSIWLGLALFGGLIFKFLADAIGPSGGSPLDLLRQARLEVLVSRISPLTLYSEASTALLDPTVRTLGVVTLQQLDGAVVSNLSVTQSLLVVWPQMVTMLAYTVICFAGAYLSFMRQEVRA